MKFPTLPHLVLLFFLGGVFLYFIQAGARTLYSKNFEFERGAFIGQFMFLVGGVIPTWFVGLDQPIHRVGGIIAACILVACIALYEWARQTIWGRRFGIGLGYQVPDALCDEGPYRYIRHPLYVSYVLAYVAVLVALPHWITATMLVVNVALFTYMARDDEKTIAASPLAAAYSEYRERTGMFLPKLSSTRPGRSMP